MAWGSSPAKSTSDGTAQTISLTAAAKGSLCLLPRISQTMNGIATLKLKDEEEKNNGKR